MGLLSQSSDYSDKDFESLRRRMRALILSTFPDWTDATVANFGNLLVELFAHVGDVLTFYQDNQAGESRITTATQRKNLLALAKLLNYVPTGASAATATMSFTLSAPVAGGRTVTLNPPATPTPTNPTIIKTQDAEDAVEFQLLSSVIITAGNSSGSGSVENSHSEAPESFSSTGLANQAYRLTRTPYLDGSAQVTASDGTYTQVTNFLQSTAVSRHFVATSDDQDRVTISFGNGTNGKIPVGTISVLYKTGGGIVGNVVANSIVSVQGSYVDSAGFPVTLTATNAAGAVGGQDRESNERIRENAPLFVKSLTRTVSRDDFETHALEIAGVDRALMLTKNEDSGIAENAGQCYIIPAGIGFPTSPLKNAVLDQFVTVYPSTITFSPSAVDPIYLDIGLRVVLFLKPGFSVNTVKANIRQAVVDFFATTASAKLIDALSLDVNVGAKNPMVDFGFNLKAFSGLPSGEVALSDLFEAVASVEGIREIGDGINDFQLVAYRVQAATTGYSSGLFPAVLVQGLNHVDVPIANTDFPRLKKTVLGGATPDIDLTIDGTHFAPGA